MAAKKQYRVIQWATGNVGTRALRTVIEHPDMKLVGLLVTSDAKVGKDAGAIAGLNQNVGVKATKSVDDIIAMDADCVVYLPAYTNYDDVCRILASGKNISTARGEFLDPAAMTPENRARVEEACRKGKTSIHCTGSSPGFITAGIPIPLLAQQRRLDCLTINEYADVSSRNSPDMIFNLMGFGAQPRPYTQEMLNHVKHDFAGSLHTLANAMNTPLEDVVAEGEMGVTKADKKIAAGLVPKGTVGALRITVSGLYKGKPILQFRANWYCNKDIDKDWELLDSGWLVQVRGDTPMDVRISFPVAPADYTAFTPGLTAHPVVNAIAAVCEAAPGIRTPLDMPRVVATF